jgi:hypothetical protein
VLLCIYEIRLIPVSGTTREGLRPAIGHAGPVQGIRRSGQPNDENATQLFGARYGSDQRASRDRYIVDYLQRDPFARRSSSQ